MSLPKGGGAIRGIGEKFSTNAATGTGSLSVPIATSPGRSGFELNLALSYDSGTGNGPFGIGWRLSMPSITRKTDKGLPRYLDAEESDTFVLSGAEDLVPVSTPADAGDDDHEVQRYRPRVEGLFARIERWTRTDDGDIHWRAITRDNVLNIYGRAPDARIADPRPDRKDLSKHPAVGRDARVFSWLLEETRDDRGNVARYRYKAEDGAGVKPSLSELSRFRIDDNGALVRDGGNPILEVRAQRYLERIQYGNRTPVTRNEPAPTEPEAWLFEVVFDYGEYASPDGDDPHVTRAPRPESLGPSRPLAIEGDGTWDVRSDPFSTYRAGFEVRTYRLCRRALMFHRFPAGTHGLEISPCLVRSTDFRYEQGPIVSYLEAVTQAGYLWKTADGEFERATLPSLSLGYAKPPENFDQTLHSIDRDSLEGIPSGVDDSFHQWVDLDGEGLPGVLTAQPRSWYYKRNEGEGQFAPPRELRSLPSPAELGSGAQLTDLAGDGQLDLVKYSSPLSGYFTRTQEGDWQPFASFSALPNIDWNDPNLRFLDLDGDGHPDILITEHNAFVWYRSRAKDGFEPAAFARKPHDESQGPAVVFADGTETIFLADMSGDGLVDIARIRNGEVCYWPNLGYGRFGRKVTFENSPRFDAPEQFDPKRIRFADIDGSGTSDILYLARDGVAIYLNQSGNALSERKLMGSLPPVDSASSLSVVDLLGQGTSCLVWSSPLPAHRARPLIYVDPLGTMPEGQHKPHILTSIVNNLGADTRIAYAPSTKFYLADRRAGRPWLTRLSFPVQVVERIERHDHVNGSRLVTRFAYHHGYFDGHEREFRGFACVEQWDAESFSGEHGKGLFPDIPYDVDSDDEALNLPPVRTVTWFHTGAWLDRERLESELAKEYYQQDPDAPLLPATVLPSGLSVFEEREATRALRGKVLRQEIYAEDSSPESDIPYSVSERNYALRLMRPAEGRRHAVFLSHPRETVELHYERNPRDPRMQQELVLSVDDFGNVLHSAKVAYARRVTDHPREQTRTWATVTSASFINRPDDPASYRLGVPVETVTWELSNLHAALPALQQRPRWERVTYEEVLAVAFADDPARTLALPLLPYHEAPADDACQLRLIEAQRVRYLGDDLRACPLAEVGRLALQHETYRLALTDGLVRGVLDHSVPADDQLAHHVVVDDGWLTDDGHYLASADVPVADGYEQLVPEALRAGAWWAPSGHVVYDDPEWGDYEARARTHFYLPEKAVDPFGAPQHVAYDGHKLQVVKTRDVMENVSRAEVDYRVLSPWALTDPNDSRTEIAFDALGMPSALWRRGHAGEGDPADKPGVVFRYDVHAFRLGHGPVWSHTASREQHGQGADARLDADTPNRVGWQHARLYADGSGREAMTKVQAEPLVTQVRDSDGRPISDPDGNPVQDIQQRWVGTGRTVFDNKGNPIKQYEPFFAFTHRYEDEKELVESGVTPILRYDPLGRLVRTDQPNGTFSKVVFDAWSQATWDENDTVVESAWYARWSAAPSVWAEVKVFADAHGAGVTALAAELKVPVPAGVDPEDTSPADKDNERGRHNLQQALLEHLGKYRQAAAQTAAHANTPTVAHLDALGRPFLSVAHTRVQDAQGQVVDKAFETRIDLDIEGNQRSVTDARQVVVQRQDFDVAGRVLHTSSPDAGDRWLLPDVADKAVRTWDGRKQAFVHRFDKLQRPTHAFVTLISGEERLLQRTVYGESLGPAARDGYLRGQVYRVYDGAGMATTEAYDFKGQPVWTARRLFDASQSAAALPDNRLAPNWAAFDVLRGDDGEAAIGPAPEAVLEAAPLTTRTPHDALGRVALSLAPDGSVTRPRYSQAGLLDAVQVWLRGLAPGAELDLELLPGGALDDDRFRTHVAKVEHNARGQRTRVVYGTDQDTQTTYAYDDRTFRLVRLVTKSGQGERLQDLRYFYDPVGNITELSDKAQIVVDPLVKAESRYVYDALYQLVEATGREHPGQSGTRANHWSASALRRSGAPQQTLPHPNDAQALRHYTQRYTYDEVGNILSFEHGVGETTRWTRHYAYEAEQVGSEYQPRSNRLHSTSTPDDGDPTQLTWPHHASRDETRYRARYEHDAHGNMKRMPHLPAIGWDPSDRMCASTKQVTTDGSDRKTTYYAYDASGQRVRKATYKNGALKDERIYAGDYEVYRESVGGFERQTLHVMDDKRRVAMVETDMAAGTPRTRYQLDNHLGSCTVELSDAGDVITYEEYFPFGGTAYRAGRGDLEVSAKRYRYNGKERDEETGLYYYGARYYAAWLGRWTAADPAGFVDGVNAYLYARANPIVRSDIDGLSSDDVARAGFEGVRAEQAYTGRLDDLHITYKAQERVGSSIEGDKHSRLDVMKENNVVEVRALDLDAATYQKGGRFSPKKAAAGIKSQKLTDTGQIARHAGDILAEDLTHTGMSTRTPLGKPKREVLLVVVHGNSPVSSSELRELRDELRAIVQRPGMQSPGYRGAAVGVTRIETFDWRKPPKRGLTAASKVAKLAGPIGTAITIVLFARNVRAQGLGPAVSEALTDVVNDQLGGGELCAGEARDVDLMHALEAMKRGDIPTPLEMQRNASLPEMNRQAELEALSMRLFGYIPTSISGRVPVH